MKTYVLMIAKTFPAHHSKAGEPTNFIERIKSGTKKHTIRGNYELWSNRIKEVRAGNAIISVRSWSGKPYKSKQIENFVLDNNDDLRFEKVKFLKDGLHLRGHGTSFTLDYATIAKNDGFDHLIDFNEWFKKTPTEPGILIYFKGFEYDDLPF